MPRNTPATQLADAEQALTDARQHRADIRMRRRTLIGEGNEIGDALHRALFDAGRTGTAPAGVDKMRERVAAIQSALEDLQRIEDGAALHVQEADNAVTAALFADAPHRDAELAKRADALEQERRTLEQQLADLGEREEGVRAEYRRLAATAPGCGELAFDGVRPVEPPTNPRPNQGHFIPDSGWPGWFVQAVTESRRAIETQGVPA